jgi:O-antigen/teichoic acid export membrane protein
MTPVEPRATGSRIGAAYRWLIHSRHGVAAIAQTIATRFLLAAMNLLMGVLTARTLGPAGRGEQSAMTLWPALLPYVLTLGMPAAIRYCMRREPDRRREFYTVAIAVAVIMSAVAFGVGILLLPISLRTYSPQIVHAAQLLMLFAPEVMISLVFTAMLETLGDFSIANVTRYVPVALTLAALAVMAVTHTMTPIASAVAYLAPPVLTAVWIGWRLREFFAPQLFDPRPSLRVLGSYGVRSYGIDVLTTLSQQIDQVLVIGILSAKSMGVYVVALSASRVLQILHSGVVTVLFPSASGLEPDRVLAMVGRAARVSSIIAVPAAIALAATIPVLIRLFYGVSFAEAIPIAQVLTLEALIGGLVSVLAQTFMALGRPGIVTILQALGLSVALPCMLVLMPRLGLMGAAVSLLISTCARLVFLLIAFPKILHVRLPNLIPNADDVASLRRSFTAGR